MKPLIKYYCNPAIFTLGAVGYFSPFFVPLPAGGVPRLVVGNLIAYAMILFLVSFLCAWVVAAVQLVFGVIGYRKQQPYWKHHVISAIWTYACYGVVIALLSNGYYLTA